MYRVACLSAILRAICGKCPLNRTWHQFEKYFLVDLGWRFFETRGMLTQLMIHDNDVSCWLRTSPRSLSLSLSPHRRSPARLKSVKVLMALLYIGKFRALWNVNTSTVQPYMFNMTKSIQKLSGRNPQQFSNAVACISHSSFQLRNAVFAAWSCPKCVPCGPRRFTAVSWFHVTFCTSKQQTHAKQGFCCSLQRLEKNAHNTTMPIHYPYFAETLWVAVTSLHSASKY